MDKTKTTDASKPIPSYKSDTRYWLDKMFIHYIRSEKLKEDKTDSLYSLIRAYEALIQMIGWDEIYTKSD